MHVDNNRWKIDTIHIVNSIARRAKIIGRSTSKTEDHYRVFQGFRRTDLNTIVSDVVEASYPSIDLNNWTDNTKVYVTVQANAIATNLYTVVIAIVDCDQISHNLIEFTIVQCDDDLCYVNCHYSPMNTKFPWRKMLNQGLF